MLRVEQYQLVQRDPDGREPIAGVRFLSCCDLSILCLRLAALPCGRMKIVGRPEVGFTLPDIVQKVP